MRLLDRWYKLWAEEASVRRGRVSAWTMGRVAALVCLLLSMGASRLAAQSTGNATLTVILSDVLQLTVNTNAVNLNFAAITNYTNGITSQIANQLTVTSNKAYDIRMRTSGPNLVSGTNTIPVSNVAVQPVSVVGGTPRVIAALSTTDQALVTGLPATLSQSITVQYSTAAGNTAFLKPAGAYLTTIIFTAVAN